MYILLVVFSLLDFSFKGNLTVKDAWVRPGGKGMNTALYFKVENQSDKADTLLSVESKVAKMVQMHETFMKNKMMGMRQVKSIVIDPKSTFEFKPGGYHVMVIGLRKNLIKGGSANFLLHFKNEGDINITAKVKMPDDN